MQYSIVFVDVRTGSMVDIQSPTAEIRRGNKGRRRRR